MSNDTELWRGRQWKITPTGMTTLDGSDYWIEKSRLGDVRKRVTEEGGDTSDWMLHMAEKTWVDIDDFIAAWCVAVAVHGVPTGAIDIGESVREARREWAVADKWEKEYMSQPDRRVPLTAKEWSERKFVRKEQDDE